MLRTTLAHVCWRLIVTVTEWEALDLHQGYKSDRIFKTLNITQESAAHRLN